MKKLKPIHPGEILDQDFLKAFQISQSKLSRDIRVPHRRINEIVLGKRNITPDTALRLAHYFGTSADVWMNLQKSYDLRIWEYENPHSYDSIPYYKEAA